jgi:O-antigen/teichoic acid export membrane protein
MGVLSAVAFGSDTVVLSLARTPRDVAEYASVYKIFTFLPIMSFMATAGFWPAVADSVAVKDGEWVARRFSNLLRINISVNTIFALALVPVLPLILRLWLGSGHQVGSSSVVAGILYALGHSLYVPSGYLLNGLQLERFHSKVLLWMAPSNLFASILLSNLFGACGPIFASAAGTLVAGLIMRRRGLAYLEKLTSNWECANAI